MERKMIFAIVLGVATCVVAAACIRTLTDWYEAAIFGLGLLGGLEAGWCFYRPDIWRIHHTRPFIRSFAYMFGEYKGESMTGLSWMAASMGCFAAVIASAYLAFTVLAEWVLAAQWFGVAVELVTYDFTLYVGKPMLVNDYAGFAVVIAVMTMLGVLILTLNKAQKKYPYPRKGVWRHFDLDTSHQRYIFAAKFAVAASLAIFTAPFWVQAGLTVFLGSIALLISVIILWLLLSVLFGTLSIIADWQMTVVTVGILVGSVASYLWNQVPLGSSEFLITLVIGSSTGCIVGWIVSKAGRIFRTPKGEAFLDGFVPWRCEEPQLELSF
jgi:hypothetical protein